MVPQPTPIFASVSVDSIEFEASIPFSLPFELCSNNIDFKSLRHSGYSVRAFFLWLTHFTRAIRGETNGFLTRVLQTNEDKRQKLPISSRLVIFSVQGPPKRKKLMATQYTVCMDEYNNSHCHALLQKRRVMKAFDS